MKYKNISGVPLKENFYGIGVIAMEPDEVKELPAAVVACWTDKTRTNGVTLLEPVKAKAEPKDEPDDVEAPDALEFEPVEAPTPKRRK